MSGPPDYKLLFESAPGAYLVLEPDSIFSIIAVSDAYLAATKTTRAQILGRGIFEVFPDDPNDPQADGVKNLGASLRRVVRESCADTMAVQKYSIPVSREGETRFEERWWSPVNSPVLDATGKLLYIVHRVEDVTEFVRLRQAGATQMAETSALRTHLESMESEILLRSQQLQASNAQLRSANEALKSMYQRTQELDQLKTQFFASVSHELRTPLTLILGPVEKLLARSDVREQRDELDTIARNARTLLRHVNDLLDVAKLEAGQLVPRYQQVDVAALLRFVSGHFEGLAKEMGIELLVQAHQPVMADTDADKLERMVLNLLSNAFKATPKGGRVRITLRTRDGRYRIEVADSGRGVPVEEREAVFERFRRLENEGTYRHAGTGLGLAIVAEFTALLKGNVSIADAPEGGALFVLDLPLTAPDGVVASRSTHAPLSDAQAANVAEQLSFERRDTAPRNVRKNASSQPLALVIEDNREMNAFIANALESDGFRVSCALDGQEGYEKALAESPELIVTDIMMPRMSGVTLVELLGQRQKLGGVIVLSARKDEALRAQLLRAGVQDYITKPFSIEELRARAWNLLRRNRAEQRTRDLLQHMEMLLVASTAVSDALAGLPNSGLESVLQTIAAQARILVDAEFAAAGIGTDPNKPFEPWTFVGVPNNVATAVGRNPRPIGVLGAALRTLRPLRVADIRKHRDYREVPEHHPAIRSFLAVPICYRGKPVGILYLGNKRQGAGFTEDDERLTERLAARAGGAMETARLYGAEAAGRVWVEKVLDQLPEGIILVDPNGHVTHKNGAAHALEDLHFEQSDRFGNVLRIDLRTSAGERLEICSWPHVRALNEQLSTIASELVVHKAGKTIPVLVHAIPVRDQQSQLTGAALVFQDISVLKELEQRREEWSSIVAHDLQQPINVITVSADLMLRSELSETQRADVQNMKRSAKRLARMVQDLKDASQLDTHHMQLKLRRVDFGEMVREATHRNAASATGVELEPMNGQRVFVQADPARLEQVLNNLLTNAIKYRTPGTTVSVGVSQQDGWARVCVRNEGPGIPAEELPSLFERYRRSGAAKRSSTEGSGLGLYIAKGLIEAQGGRISAQSVRGEATTFCVELPLDTSRSTPPPPL